MGILLLLKMLTLSIKDNHKYYLLSMDTSNHMTVGVQVRVSTARVILGQAHSIAKYGSQTQELLTKVDYIKVDHDIVHKIKG